MSSSSRNKAIVRYNTGETGQTATDGSSDASPAKRAKKSNETTEQTLDAEAVDRVANDCVKYLVISDHKKIAVKRVDMIKTVVKKSLTRKTIDEIIEVVRRELLSTFGIELVECPDAAAVSYILVSKLPTDRLSQVVANRVVPDRQHIESAILCPILAVIYMSGGSVDENVIWDFVRRLGFDDEPKSKKLVFQDESSGLTIRKLVSDLWVKQMYLKYTKLTRNETVDHQFQWGFRAECEFNKMDMLKFVCQVLGPANKPEEWRTQYEAAKEANTSNEPTNGNNIEAMVE